MRKEVCFSFFDISWNRFLDVKINVPKINVLQFSSFGPYSKATHQRAIYQLVDKEAELKIAE